MLLKIISFLCHYSFRFILKSFTELFNYPKYDIPRKHGSKYYYSANSGLEDQAKVYELDTLESKPKVFIDPNKFSAKRPISLSFLSFTKNGKYCAYGMSSAGSDWITIKIKDTKTGIDFNETLEKIKFSEPFWTTDNLGFFYSVIVFIEILLIKVKTIFFFVIFIKQYDEYEGTGQGSDPEAIRNQKVYYHRLNTKQTEDILITSFPNHPLWVM